MAKPELKIEKLATGNGAAPKKGDTVTVHYTGTFTDGKKFDSSVDRDEPFASCSARAKSSPAGILGVAQMKIGDKVKLTIPPELAYGRDGYPGAIPPNATLDFRGRTARHQLTGGTARRRPLFVNFSARKPGAICYSRGRN